jgi:hypothetical protein
MRAAFIESNPLPVKAALTLMGKFENVLRFRSCRSTTRSAACAMRCGRRECLMRNDGHALDDEFVASCCAIADTPAASRFRRMRNVLSTRARRARARERARRGAGRDGNVACGPWVKRGILLGFRVGRIVDMSLGGHHGEPFGFFDKHTYPPQRPTRAVCAIVPGGSSVRRGAYLAPGVVCMPPMYVNVGA